jgi:hypothetical protein
VLTTLSRTVDTHGRPIVGGPVTAPHPAGGRAPSAPFAYVHVPPERIAAMVAKIDEHTQARRPQRRTWVLRVLS